MVVIQLFGAKSAGEDYLRGLGTSKKLMLIKFFTSRYQFQIMPEARVTNPALKHT